MQPTSDRTIMVDVLSIFYCEAGRCLICATPALGN
jgi:hypothetical protein